MFCESFGILAQSSIASNSAQTRGEKGEKRLERRISFLQISYTLLMLGGKGLQNQ